MKSIKTFGVFLFVVFCMLPLGAWLVFWYKHFPNPEIQRRVCRKRSRAHLRVVK